MRLAEMTKDMRMINSISGKADTEISGVQYDSRKVGKGDLFVAVSGGHFDGADFIPQAVEAGASAVVSESVSRPAGLPEELPYVGVSDTRDALAYLSSVYYDRPSARVRVVGITGTNGKTTTAYLLRAALSAAGHKVGMVGTVNYMVGDELLPAPYTTPEAPEFQELLARMRDEGCAYAVSEVSSHALAQRRIDHTRFRAAVFMNLTSEHLDFHHTMDEYFRAKSRLFTELLEGPAVINVDDPYGRELAGMISGPVLTFSAEGEADIAARDVVSGRGGLSFTLRHGGVSREVRSGLLGRPNAWNMLAAAGTCIALGLGLDESLDVITSAPPVDGRFWRVEEGQDFLCIIDYAHTGDALRRLLESAREFTPEGGRVITVFGCGGDRDRTKRPVMGAAATELSDMVIITSDNPRGEDPGSIIDDIVTGVLRANHAVIPDRGEAIRAAVEDAGSGDTVIIAGKGHEEYQEAGGVRSRFSDYEAAVEAIRSARGRG
jgi:UDP-N-acetylmuramoyl-L-alanyl-D-glutamate--2,6-diaminopimelate ligase